MSAQTRVRNYNYEGFKKKSHYFGLTLALNSSGFKVEHSRTLRPEGAFKVNEGVASPGLTLSMITNFKIGEYFDYRLLPFHFTFLPKVDLRTQPLVALFRRICWNRYLVKSL
ncbi:MAG: hypothetical protein IPF46_04710 [Saprospiraceae bacterium]|nr:hypothetical protein [Candidatus Vicinibacter affinis]